jgi:predicted Zn-dependent protease
VIKLPKKKYTPKQDVQLGKEAASEVRKQYPIIEDQHIAKYLTQIGNRLVAAAPTELKQSVYEYSFTPVNLKDINAFALPGGPMFVQRGMFDAAAEEAEVAGVMAHELSRVLLRHGTANASKAQSPWLQLGQIAGAVVGGELGGYIAEGTQFGLGTLLLRYSRDYEKQADHLGAQIMARGRLRPARARSCAKSKRVNSAQQDRNLVPNGAVLVHPPHRYPGHRRCSFTSQTGATFTSVLRADFALAVRTAFHSPSARWCLRSVK